MYKYWTDQERSFLREHYGKITVGEIMKTIKRSRRSIEKQAERLELFSKAPGAPTYANPHNKGKSGPTGEDHHAYHSPGTTWEAAGRVYFRRSAGSPVEVYSRYVMEQAGYDISGKVVAHKDGDPLNCTVENLVVLTREQNAIRNSKRCKDPELRDARRRMAKTGESLAELILKGEFV